MGTVIGTELRSLWLQGVTEYSINNPSGPYAHLGLDCWSPNVGIQRDPRWGRNLESPSEDPYLAGVFGTMVTLGLQNNTLDTRYLQAVSTLKHFTANSIEGQYWTEDGQWLPKNGSISRHNVNSLVSLYDLTTSYLPAFGMAIKEGGAAGIMCSFNRINGVPSCVNERLLKQILRHDWEFRGYVSSDTGGLVDVRDNHHYTHDWMSTVALAIKAGCDVESGGSGARGTTDTLYIRHLPEAVRSGYLNEESVDKALKNAFAIRFRLGLFDPIENQPFWHVPPQAVRSPQHVRLSQEGTAQGFVLLKNDRGIVPMELSTKVALIGPHIHDRKVMVGNYVGEICQDDGTNACVTSFLEGFTNVTLSSSMSGSTVRASEGCTVSGNDTSRFDEALRLAAESDVVVFLGGLDLHLEAEDWDRPDIHLPPIQVDLIHKLSKACSNIVLVLLHGGMVGLDDVLDKVSSVVSIGYPGPFAGMVLPRALYGLELHGWGKTTVTWYHNTIMEELNMMDFDMAKEPGRTYRYYKFQPIFPFGYGLNPLTTFALGNLSLTANTYHSGYPSLVFPCRELELSVVLSNTGGRSADEVVLAYFVPLEIPSAQPASMLRKQLFGFERIHLQSGKSVIVKFLVTATTLQLANDAGDVMTFPGLYSLQLSNGEDWASTTIEVGSDGSLSHAIKDNSDQMTAMGY